MYQLNLRQDQLQLVFDIICQGQYGGAMVERIVELKRIIQEAASKPEVIEVKKSNTEMAAIKK